MPSDKIDGAIEWCDRMEERQNERGTAEADG